MLDGQMDATLLVPVPCFQVDHGHPAHANGLHFHRVLGAELAVHRLVVFHCLHRRVCESERESHDLASGSCGVAPILSTLLSCHRLGNLCLGTATKHRLRTRESHDHHGLTDQSPRAVPVCVPSGPESVLNTRCLELQVSDSHLGVLAAGRDGGCCCAVHPPSIRQARLFR